MLSPTTTHPARHRAQLITTGASVMRGSTPVLTCIDLTISSTSRVAIVGENGRGKSTLLHVLAGVIAPDEGSVQRLGTLGIAEQEMPTGDDRTVGCAVAEAIGPHLSALAALDLAAADLASGTPGAEGRYTFALETADSLDAWGAERRVRIALEALDAVTDPNRRLDDLSVGERYRVRLACLLGSDYDFLLFDEPTNHLDGRGLDFLTGQLRARSGGVVVVTHDRALLTDLAETIVDLDPTPDGRARVYGDGYEGYCKGRRAERERWEQDFDRQQSEVSRLQESLSVAQNRLVSGWRPEKGTNKYGRATRAGGLVQSVHRRQSQLEALAVPVPEPPQVLRFPALARRSDAALLSVNDVSVAGRLGHVVTFSMRSGGRLVVIGPNGSGKSTLLNVVAGLIPPDSGSVSRPQGARLGFLQQESVLPLDRRASDVYSTHVEAIAATGMIPAGGFIELSQLGLLRTGDANKQIGELSMGQQRRLDLAMVISSRPHILLLDEPTNHLSIALVDELTDALHATSAAVVLSSHDRQMLRDVDGWPALHLAAVAGATEG